MTTMTQLTLADFKNTVIPEIKGISFKKAVSDDPLGISIIFIDFVNGLHSKKFIDSETVNELEDEFEKILSEL